MAAKKSKQKSKSAMFYIEHDIFTVHENRISTKMKNVRTFGVMEPGFWMTCQHHSNASNR